MRRFALLIALFSISPLIAHQALAEAPRDGVFVCGHPAANNDLSTTGPEQGACDIYSRRFEYREKRNELRDLLNERAKNYGANGAAMRASYQEQLETLHNSIDSNSPY